MIRQRHALLRVFVFLAVSLPWALEAATAPDLFYSGKPTGNEPDVAPWKESPVATPTYPRDADLVTVSLGPTDTLKLYVDSASLSVAGDGVSRLTIVVESSSGSRNVYFDGIRCETREYKTYAVGSPEGKWVQIKDARWRDLPRPANNAFRFFLAQHYACSDIASAVTPREFLQRLR